MDTLDTTYHNLITLFIEKNKEFTDAMRAKKSHDDLKVIYEDITAINDELNEFKASRMTA